MRVLFDTKELLFPKTKKLPMKCERCDEVFYIEKKLIKYYLSQRKNSGKFCSNACKYSNLITSAILSCKKCNCIVNRRKSQLKKSKSGNVFCSTSCSAKYNNVHKTKGNRRSKLEIWIESQLNFSYPNLIIKFNDKETINSELDIYISSLNLAIELNGIFHYEPIHGSSKLSSIKENDIRKFQSCSERQIDLFVINVSGQKYFQEKTSIKYLKIIENIINNRLL